MSYDQDAAEARFDDEMAQLERIAELESLVMDMFPAINFYVPGVDNEDIEQRMFALGLLDGDES